MRKHHTSVDSVVRTNATLCHGLYPTACLRSFLIKFYISDLADNKKTFSSCHLGHSSLDLTRDDFELVGMKIAPPLFRLNHESPTVVGSPLDEPANTCSECKWSTCWGSKSLYFFSCQFSLLALANQYALSSWTCTISTVTNEVLQFVSLDNPYQMWKGRHSASLEQGSVVPGFLDGVFDEWSITLRVSDTCAPPWSRDNFFFYNQCN